MTEPLFIPSINKTIEDIIEYHTKLVTIMASEYVMYCPTALNTVEALRKIRMQSINVMIYKYIDGKLMYKKSRLLDIKGGEIVAFIHKTQRSMAIFERAIIKEFAVIHKKKDTEQEEIKLDSLSERY